VKGVTQSALIWILNLSEYTFTGVASFVTHMIHKFIEAAVHLLVEVLIVSVRVVVVPDKLYATEIHVESPELFASSQLAPDARWVALQLPR
jgi:Na+-transporting NADH:ubiquinone oxidoreductase subunit NqrD